MIKVRIIDTDGKDEVHTVVKATQVQDKMWFYSHGFQYYVPIEDIKFMQIWSDDDGTSK